VEPGDQADDRRTRSPKTGHLFTKLRLVTRRIAIAGGIVASIALLCYPVTWRLLRYAWWRVAEPSDAGRFLAVNGARLYVEEHGRGAPVLLLPGGLTTIDSFFAQLPWLSSRFRTIAIEPRGHGRSTPTTELTYRLLAEDALSVMDELDIETAAVVGWSDGGTTALMMSLLQPERVSRIVAISANFDPDAVPADNGDGALGGADGQYCLAHVVYRWRAGAGGDWPALKRAVVRMWQTRPVLPLDALVAVKVPTLLIVGSNDLIPVEHIRQMAAKMPSAEVVVIPEGRHTSLIWDAKDVNALLERFLPVQPGHD